MAGQSVVSICNLSLLSIGARVQIQSLTEGSPEANACSTLFQFVYEQLARTAYWNCLRKQASLTLLAAAPGTPENLDGTAAATPPQPWLYMYANPADSLAARYIVPTCPPTGMSPISPAMMVAAPIIPVPEQIPFQVAYSTDSDNNPISVILTNLRSAQMVYTVNQPNPTIWDSSFQAAMVASLGTYLVPALSLNAALIKFQADMAEKLIMEARVRDGNEGSNTQDHVPDWLRARTVGSGYGYGGYLSNAGYSNIAWPTG